MLKNIFLIVFFLFFGFEILAEEKRAITVHALKYFPPQYMLDSDGKPIGFAIDVIEEVANIADLKIEYLIFDDWVDSNRAFFDEKIGDVVPNSGITQKRAENAIFSIPIETIQIRMFKRANSTEIHTKEDIAGVKVGVVKFNSGHTLLKDHNPLLLSLFDTIEEAFNALLSAQIDVLVFPDVPVLSMIQKAGVKNHIVPFGVPLDDIKRGIRIQKDDPILAEKLNEALKKLLASPKYLDIYKKWHSYEPSYRNLKHIRAAGEGTYPPFSTTNSDGEADGFSVELLKEALNVMGIEVTFKVDAWSAIQDELARGEIDVLPAVGKTSKRELIYDFTTPYLQMFGAVVVRKDNSDIKNIEDLKNRKIITVKNSSAEKFIKKEQISENIIYTDIYEDAFKMLSDGEGDAIIVQEYVAKELFEKLKIDNLKILDVQLSQFRQDFSFAVQEGNAELLAILNEGLANLKADGTFERLHKKWFPYLYEKQIDMRFVYALVAILVFLLVALIVLWRWKIVLSHEVDKKTDELKNMNKTLALRVEDGIKRELKLERERQVQEAILIQQSKMAALGEMIGAIAHQWKQPINIISLFAQNTLDMLEYDEVDIEKFKQDERHIIQQVEFMAQTIDDFKNFFSPTKEVSSFDPYEAIKITLRILAAPLKKRSIEVTVDTANNKNVVGYPNELRHAIFNIINNAKDVLEERKIKSPKIEIRFESKDNMQIIYIKDNGGGIDSALLPDKLFEPYITTKGEKGTGVGLQICKIVIEKNMNGEISARNTEDGAEFIIKIPVSNKE